MIYHVSFEFIRLIIRILVIIVSFINYQTFFDSNLIYVFVFKYICVNSFLLLWSYVIFDENFEDWSNSKIMKKVLYLNRSVEIKNFRKNIKFVIWEIDFFSLSNVWSYFFFESHEIFCDVESTKRILWLLLWYVKIFVKNDCKNDCKNNCKNVCSSISKILWRLIEETKMRWWKMKKCKVIKCCDRHYENVFEKLWFWFLIKNIVNDDCLNIWIFRKFDEKWLRKLECVNEKWLKKLKCVDEKLLKKLKCVDEELLKKLKCVDEKLLKKMK